MSTTAVQTEVQDDLQTRAEGSPETSASFHQNEGASEGFISLSEIISALSCALELTDSAAQGHALRSCLLGMRIGAEAQLNENQITSLFCALQLKDIDCGSNAGRTAPRTAKGTAGGSQYPVLRPLQQLWNNVVPEPGTMIRFFSIGQAQRRSMAEMIGMRRDRAARIVTKLGMGHATARAVRNLDERWDGAGYPDGRKGEQIPVLSRICAVAQHLDLVSSRRGIAKAIEMLERRSVTWFDPALVAIAVSLHRRGLLWTHCRPTDSLEDTRQAVSDMDPGSMQKLEPARIDQICEAFADVVDAKSPFTWRHSIGVADAAFRIASAMGLPKERIQLVRRAALLHDIGKLGIPNEVLEKRGRLNEKEWRAVQQHPALTRRILERVSFFREMAIIAGEHHEKLDGTGYPLGLKAEDLSIESRIVAVADVYGALLEDRPYRPALAVEDIFTIMRSLVPNQLDATCFEALVSTTTGRRDVVSVPVPQIADLPLGYALKSAV